MKILMSIDVLKCLIHFTRVKKVKVCLLTLSSNRGQGTWSQHPVTNHNASRWKFPIIDYSHEGVGIVCAGREVAMRANDASH